MDQHLMVMAFPPFSPPPVSFSRCERPGPPSLREGDGEGDPIKGPPCDKGSIKGPHLAIFLMQSDAGIAIPQVCERVVARKINEGLQEETHLIYIIEM